jgi:hypothetical protein
MMPRRSFNPGGSRPQIRKHVIGSPPLQGAHVLGLENRLIDTHTREGNGGPEAGGHDSRICWAAAQTD